MRPTLAVANPPSCSRNSLGGAGAEGLVKGDWSELHILDIRWVEMGWLHSTQQRNTSMK
jgi:hypothetical protein